MASNPSKWNIWSTEHMAWWRPNSQGYTMKRDEAGEYSYREAREIVEGCNGRDEHMVPAESPDERLKAISDTACRAVSKAVAEYHCTRHRDDEDQGLSLVDVLTPEGEGTIKLGKEEVESLIDFIQGEVDQALSARPE